MTIKEENEIEKRIRTACDNLGDFLICKNRKYGNSALEPLGIYGGGDPSKLIDTRIDDKLNRIKNHRKLNLDKPHRKNDIFDNTGYNILYIVSEGWENDFDEEIE